MLPLALRVFARTAFVLSTAAIFSVSCSRQGEGDRCDLDWGGPDQDCQSDLICTACGNLQDATVDRCCRRDSSVTDARCAKAAVPNDLTCSAHKNLPATGAAGSGGTAGRGGTAGSGTLSNGGTGESSSTGGLAGQPAGGNAGE
jgi:hypothetical protein